MSRISQDFINDLGFLYEHVHIKDQDFLNEESEYYDEEAAEMVEDILSTISASMVCEGYSAEAIIGFLLDCSEETIIEKYLSFDENILTESVVPEDYIIEQLEIFDFAINEGLGSLIGKVAKGAVSLAGRVASKPARVAVAKKMMKSKDPAKTAAAVDRLARMKLNKAGAPSDVTKKFVDAAPDVATKTRIAATAPVVGKLVKGVQKVKDIASKAKAALPGIAKGAGMVGLGAVGGYVGSKMAGAGSGQQVSAKPSPSTSSKDDFLKGSALAKLGGKEGRVKGGEFRTMSWSPESKARYAAASKGSAKPSPTPSATPSASGGGSSSAPKSSAPKKAESGTPMQQWAKANPQLASKVKPGQSGYQEISGMRDKPGPGEKKDQTPTTGKPEAKVDTKSVESDIKAEQERLKKKAAQSAATTKESYDAYDVILEYLIDTNQVDTIEEAHYVMLEMDSEAIRNIFEAKYRTEVM